MSHVEQKFGTLRRSGFGYNDLCTVHTLMQYREEHECASNDAPPAELAHARTVLLVMLVHMPIRRSLL